MVTVSIISIVILIFVLHTILTHLLNWAFRESMKDLDGMMTFIIIATFTECVVMVGLIDYILN